MRSRKKWLPLLFVLGLLCSFATSAGAVKLHFRYPETNRFLLNPYIGNVAWGDSLSEREQPFTLVYCDATWAELEPEKGVYAFAGWEEDYHIEHWRAEGKHVVFRLVLDRPGEKKHMDIPQWLYDEMGKDGGEYYKISYGRGFSPNYENPVLIEAHARLIRALGERYGDDPVFAFIQLGSLGHWGEWHTHDSLPSVPDANVRDAYVAPYAAAFPNAYLLMRRPFTHALKYEAGLYNDTAGDTDATEEWLDWIAAGGQYNETDEKDALVPMPLAWQTAPIGGELSTGYDREEFLEEDMLEETIRLFSLSHASWIGPGSFVEVRRDGELQKALDELLSRVGYRLRVSSMTVDASAPDAITFFLTWENTGNAPFYFDWRPSVRITSETGEEWLKTMDFSLNELLPGKPAESGFSLSREALSGTFRVAVGIVDPGTGEARVALAMDVETEGGWHELCSLSL